MCTGARPLLLTVPLSASHASWSSRLFVMFGLVVVFPTYIYKIVITYAMVRRRGRPWAPPLRNALL